MFPFKEGNVDIDKRKYIKHWFPGTTSHAKCANYRGTFWCATSLKANGAYDKWGKCKMDTCRPEGRDYYFLIYFFYFYTLTRFFQLLETPVPLRTGLSASFPSRTVRGIKSYKKSVKPVRRLNHPQPVRRLQGEEVVCNVAEV